MSPALPYTCFFWSMRDCKFHEDDCLYSHSSYAAPPEAPRHFGYRQPALSGRNAAIAQAAANAGFDTSNWSALTNLISSVKNANWFYKAPGVPIMLRAYGGMYTTLIGPSKRRATSRGYPDHYAPSALQPDIFQAETIRPESRRSEAKNTEIRYAKTERTSGVTLDGCSELPERVRLREQEDLMRRSASPIGNRYGDISSNPPRAAPSGANTMPLGPLAKKRGVPDAEQELKAFKMRRTEDVSMGGVTAVHNGLLVDLTGEGNRDYPYHGRSALRDMTNTNGRGMVTRSHASNAHDFARNLGIYSPHGNVTITAPYGRTTTSTNSMTFNPNNGLGSRSNTPATGGASRRQRRATATQQKQMTDSATTKAFKKVRSRLLLCQNSMKLDREALSARWESDARLKEPETMDSLQQLSSHMLQIEEGLTAAIGVMGKLL
ncbi:hypothetical protein MMC13_002312 [Lambiella insularis]|nr:hypothetical protein [Lambiella insularis]